MGNHYPGDVVLGAFSGMAVTEIVRRVQRAVVRAAVVILTDRLEKM